MSTQSHIVCPHCYATNRISSTRLADQPRCGRCKQPLFTGQPIELNDQNFAQFIAKSDLPIVVDFWADWCAPCKMMAPAFAQASAQLAPQVIFAKLNTEVAQQSAAQFAIRSIPTLILFKNGQEAARQAGALNLQQIVQWVNMHT